ncbi:MAG TPA: delta-60 repeat domain-containing protein [Candidatus Angelobacter sp.]|jgi:uncharacterized delta-60 repeat protein|nr:delta-60 repeat domain-containing protein [Candidatus Angelobacter sp.]
MKKFVLPLLSGFIFFGLTVVNASLANAQALDSSFGAGGKVEANFGVSVAPSDATLQPDGKIVVVGTTDNFQIANQVFGVTRFLPNGSLDTTFGNRGATLLAFTNFINTPNAVAIQPDGKIVVAGETQSSDGSINRFAIARFNPTGSLDTTFGSAGKVMPEFFSVTFGGVREAADVILLQPDNKIIVAGIAVQGARLPAKSALVRLNSNGTLDQTFGNGGTVAINAIGLVTALALLSNGQILVLNNVGGIAQFNSNGTLAPSVTSGTIVATANNGVSAFESNGRFVIAGGAAGITRRDIDVTVISFTPTGSIDHTFNSPVFDFGQENTISSDLAQVVAIQPDGKIVVGGLLFNNSGSVFGLGRLNTNGSLDSTFGNGGVLTTRFEGSDQVSSILIQPDGKILAIGQAFDSSTGQGNLALARYLP